MAHGAGLAGAGILQTPLPYVAADLAAGRLVSVLEGWPPPAIYGFHLYYPKSRQMRPALKALVELLRRTRDPQRAAQGGLRKTGPVRTV
jgi:DNA-binding transcriptional LysR family regulator